LQSFLPERIFVLPQSELRVQQAAGNRPDTLVEVHTGRGTPRSPPRQGGPTEIRDYTRHHRTGRFGLTSESGLDMLTHFRGHENGWIHQIPVPATWSIINFSKEKTHGKRQQQSEERQEEEETQKAGS
jgi:hypothetical protein